MRSLDDIKKTLDCGLRKGIHQTIAGIYFSCGLSHGESNIRAENIENCDKLVDSIYDDIRFSIPAKKKKGRGLHVNKPLINDCLVSGMKQGIYDAIVSILREDCDYSVTDAEEKAIEVLDLKTISAMSSFIYEGGCCY